jgi:predicted PilT family ATPase
LTCEKDGVKITIRTIVLYEDGTLVTADRFEGQTIDVMGIVDSYTPKGSTEAQIQIRVFSLDAITIH